MRAPCSNSIGRHAPGLFRRVAYLLVGLGLLSGSLASSASAASAFKDVSGSPFGSVGDPVSFAFGPSGRFLAASDSGGNDVGVYAVAPNGRLKPVHGSPFSTGPSSTTSNGGLAISPNGRRLAVVSDGGVRIFAVSRSGRLYPPLGTFFNDEYKGSDELPSVPAYSPNGSLLATANTDTNTVSVWSVAPGGGLTPITKPLPTGQAPVAIGFDPNGKLLVTADENDGTLGLFRVAGKSVTPEAGSPVKFGEAPTALAFNPSGSLLAVTDFGGADQDDVWLAKVHASTVKKYPFPFSAQPGVEGVAFSPNGHLLATANGNVSTMSVFTVNAARPSLTQVRGSPYFGPALTVAFSPKGRFLAGSAAGVMYMFAATPPALRIASGSLTSNHNALRVRVSCSGGAEIPSCRGRLTYAVRRGHGSTVLGSSSFALGKGVRRTLSLELSHAHKKLLIKLLHKARHHRVRVLATETLQGAAALHTSFVI